jgi:hypothetical protein
MSSETNTPATTPTAAALPTAPEPPPGAFSLDPEEFLAITREPMRALRDEQLLTLFTDPMATAATIAAKALRIRAMSAEIAAHAPTFPKATLALLEPAAATLAHLHGLSLGQTRRPNEAPERLEKAVVRREVLYNSAKFVAIANDLDAAPLERLHAASNGYTDTSSAMLGYIAMHYDESGALRARSPLSAAELDEARKEAMELAFYAGVRDDRADEAALADQRRRAYTLAVNTYNKVRSVISYIRYDFGDADSIAPALGNRPYSKSSKGPRDEKDEPADDDAAAGTALKPAPIGPVDEDPIER